MKSLRLRNILSFLLALSLASAFAQEPESPPAAEALPGVWEGAIEIPGMPLEVTVNLGQVDGEWQGTIDIPAQGAAGIPLEAISTEGEVVSFMISGTPGEPTFQGTVAGDEMTGTFSQAGQEFPFTLTLNEEAEAPVVGPPTEGEYVDPEGRFSFPVPTGWTVEEEEGYVTAVGPEGDILMHIVVTEGEDLAAIVEQSWERVDPELELEEVETLEPPPSAGIERSIVVNYDFGDDDQVYQAFSDLYEGTAYTLLVEADLAAVQRRSAQLQIIATGFEITDLEETDLTGIEPRDVEEIIPELEAFTQEWLEAFGIPGAAVAIVQDEEIVYANGFGVTEAGGEEPVTADTHMMIGSTGKTMTSMLVATLVDDGIVDWDTPVVDVLSEFEVADPELTEAITMRNLLCACTGVPRRDYELFFNSDELSAEAVVESLGTFEFFTDFGEAFQYSNQLVGTAGYAAAAANGYEFGNLFAGYAESLQERVLDPIGLENTTLSFHEVRERDEYAVPHQLELTSGEYEPIDLSLEESLLPIAPAGAHWSTAEDMARYMITELNVGVTPDGERVVSEENLRVTWESQVQVSATESYGLGWFIGEYHGLDWLYHGGNTLGFSSEFVFLPGIDLGIVVITNGQGTNSFNGAVAERLLELVFDQPSTSESALAFVVEQTERSITESQEQIQDAVDPAEVEAFVGSYSNPALGELELELVDGRLYADAGEFRVEVLPYLDRQGEFESYVTYGAPLTGLPLELETSEEGDEQVIFGTGAISYTFERTEGAE